MREKRDAEEKRLREGLRERQAEAERRREEILARSNARRGRTSSASKDSGVRARKSLSPPQEEQEEPASLSWDEAVVRIQRFWRVERRSMRLRKFAELGLTIDRVRETSFDDITDILAKNEVLMATAYVLRLCGLKEGEEGSVDEMTAVRTFLSAYLILGHPTEVLVRPDVRMKGQHASDKDLANPQLQELITKAKDLLVTFEHVLSRLTRSNNYTPPPSLADPLSETYAAFYNAFIAWKARDSTTLVDMMLAQFVELDAIWQTVKDSTEEAVTSSYRDALRENQTLLVVRIKQLAGPNEGKRLIARAIQQARAKRAPAKRPTADVKPRATGDATSASTLEDMGEPGAAIDEHLQTLTPPATPTRLPPKQQPHTFTLREVLGQHPSAIPPNRVVVHELAIDKNYRFDATEILEKRKAVTERTLDAMRQHISSSGSNEWILTVGEHVKARLLNLLLPQSSMHRLVREVLDPEVLAQQIQRGSFSIEAFFTFLGQTIPKLCAPVRDAEVKHLVEVDFKQDDYVSRLGALFRILDILQMDYANFRLASSANELIKEAVNYEKREFSKLYPLPTVLPIAKKWWTAARAKVLEEAARRDPENVNLPRSRPTAKRFYNQMLVDVFTDISYEGAYTIPEPETLCFDLGRIKECKLQILNIVLSGAILLQAKNLLKRDIRSQWKTEMARIGTVLATAKNVDEIVNGICAALESCRNMPTATKTHLRGVVRGVVMTAEPLIKAVVDHYDKSPQDSQAPTASNPVVRLLLTRLRGHILSRVSATTENERVTAMSTSSEKLATLGLPEFVGKVGEIVNMINTVGNVDIKCHEEWYNLIEEEVKKETEGAAAAR
jgi:hypothetical protein